MLNRTCNLFIAYHENAFPPRLSFKPRMDFVCDNVSRILSQSFSNKCKQPVSVSVSVLEVREDGSFISVSNSHTPYFHTLTDLLGTLGLGSESVAARLWMDDSMRVYTVPDTVEAEREGMFKFIEPAQRQVLKSLMCYKVCGPNGQPICIMDINASKEMVFPEQGSEDFYKEIGVYMPAFDSLVRVIYNNFN